MSLTEDLERGWTRLCVSTAVVALLAASVPTAVGVATGIGAGPARADSLVASLELNANPHDIVIDSAGVYAYTTTCDYGGIPAGIVRIDLATFTIDDSLALSSDCGRAVQIVDDSIYVTTSDRFYRFDADTFGTSTDDSVAIADYGNGLAVSGSFAYIAHHAGDAGDKITKVDISGATMSTSTPFSSGGVYPMSISIDPTGTNAYVVHTNSNTMTKINLTTDTVAGSVAIGQQSYGLALDDSGTYAYVPAAMPLSPATSPWLVRIDLDTLTMDDTVDLPFRWGFDVALSPDGATAYVGESRGGRQVAKINLGSTMSLAETFDVNYGPHSLVVNPAGTFLYTADYNDHNETKVSKAAIGASVGAPTVTGLSVATGPLAGGGTTIVSGTNLSGATGVSFGATAATILSGSDDTIAVTIPAAVTAGEVTVTVTTPAGTSTETISFTYVDPAPDPEPTPVVPPSAPGLPTATPGPRSASVIWAAPDSPGSFAVSTYRVTATPGGYTCLTAELTCEVTGLHDDVSYTFTVTALNGAGWSQPSPPSNAITPITPSITITGVREGKRLVISGMTSGLKPGSRVTPWSSRPGRSTIKGRSITIEADGSFTWSRRASTKSTWQIRVTNGSGVRSNVLIFR